MERDLVSCVMVTGKTPRHLSLALRAVHSFLAQDYLARELIVVNDGPIPLLASVCDPLWHNVREIHCPLLPPSQKRTLGELRNIGLEAAAGSWLAQWDDDDFYHPGRLSYMMQYARPDHAVLLNWQIRYSFATGNAFALRYDRPTEGIPGTALYPNGPWRYPAEGKHEDSHFLNEHFHNRRVILDNRVKQYPGPAYYLRFFHSSDLNTWDERHIMRRYAASRTELRNTAFDMRPEHLAYLRQVLTDYYSVPVLPEFQQAA